MLQEEPVETAFPKLGRRTRGVKPNSPPIAVGRKIRSIRLKKELSLSQVAKATNLSVSMLSQIENEKVIPKLSTLLRISEVYSVRLSDILDGCGKKEVHFYRGQQRDKINNIALQPAKILLGRHVGKDFLTESYLITHIFKEKIISANYRNMTELIYMLEGNITYEHGGDKFPMSCGDSILIHGRDGRETYSVDRVPVRFIKIISTLRQSQSM